LPYPHLGEDLMQTTSYLRRRYYRPRLEGLEVRNLLSTFTVDHLADDLVGDGLNGSLRYCITNATDGDDIQFGVQGTINLTRALPDLTHSINIEGPGPDLLTVRRDTGGNYRIFTVGGSNAVSIAGLTIANGYASYDYGGGIYNNHGALTVTNSTVSGNLSAGFGVDGLGGGIYNNGGTLTLTNSTVSGNTAQDGTPDFEGSGGGIYNNGGALTLNDSTVRGNRGRLGGGIYDNGGTLTLNDSTVSGNSAPFGHGGGGYGGGIYNYNDVGMLNNSTVSGNSSIHGGGIFNDTATFTVSNSTVSGNHGEGIYIYRGGGTFTLTNSTVSGNSVPSGGDGGGIYIYYLYSGTLNPFDTVLAGNMAGTDPDLHGNLGSLGHNLIGNTQGGSGFDPTDLLNVDPLLGPLQANGGPTQTMALLPGSPALNAGDPDQLGSTDQRGVVRSGGVNIGAYQASASAFVLSAPDRVQAGVPFDVTVTAVDPFGQLAVGYTGTVTFGTTDPGPRAVLPADYTFTPGDGGVHTFTDTGLGETTLVTPGEQSLTVTDTAAGTITGAATVTVGSAAPGAWQAPVSHSGPGTVPSTALTGSARPGQEVLNADRFFAWLLSEGARSLRSPKHARGEEPGPWGLQWPGQPGLWDA
jgi:hypothetical protein